MSCIQVRGPRPCCVLRALVNFVDLHLDDDSDDAPSVDDDVQAVDKSSSSVLSTVLSSELDRHHHSGAVGGPVGCHHHSGSLEDRRQSDPENCHHRSAEDREDSHHSGGSTVERQYSGVPEDSGQENRHHSETPEDHQLLRWTAIAARSRKTAIQRCADRSGDGEFDFRLSRSSEDSGPVDRNHHSGGVGGVGGVGGMGGMGGGPLSLLCDGGSVTTESSFQSADNVDLDVSGEADTSRQLYFLCPKCVLLGEPWPERISYRYACCSYRYAVRCAVVVFGCWSSS